jgi:hypothetical protein
MALDIKSKLWLQIDRHHARIYIDFFEFRLILFSLCKHETSRRLPQEMPHHSYSTHKKSPDFEGDLISRVQLTPHELHSYLLMKLFCSSNSFLFCSSKRFMRVLPRASLNLNLCKHLELQLFAGWVQNWVSYSLVCGEDSNPPSSFTFGHPNSVLPGALLCVPQSLFGPPAALFFCLCLWSALTFRYFNQTI